MGADTFVIRREDTSHIITDAVDGFQRGQGDKIKLVGFEPEELTLWHIEFDRWWVLSEAEPVMDDNGTLLGYSGNFVVGVLPEGPDYGQPSSLTLNDFIFA